MGAGGNPFPIIDELNGSDAWSGPVPRITSLLIKPASAVCNLDCSYCFYLDRDAFPKIARQSNSPGPTALPVTATKRHG